MPIAQINLEGWQDYIGKESGILLYVETSMQSVLPVRDQLNDNEKGAFWEPNYETSTWGLESCLYAKRVNAIVKAKHKYVFFGTRYAGFDADYTDKYLIMGFMEVSKTRDMRERHIRQYMLNAEEGTPEPECMMLNESLALYGDMHFVGLEDSFEVTHDWLKGHELRGRPTRQLRLVMEDEPLTEVMEHLKSKPNIIGEYVQIAHEFKLAMLADEDD
ncbi:MAG: hypothetical protein GX801_07900 [Fibrobacter sp.]|nr:hypothetical protein [Fibrobacter sp.]